MLYKLDVTDDAHYDLDKIAEYISINLDNPIAAYKFLDEVESVYNNIIENPLMYPLHNYNELGKKGYRKVVINNYIMIYKFDEEKKTINILRFFFGHRDYTRYM